MGVPWLGWTCGQCRYCQRGHENLCEAARFTVYQLDGGYAEFTVADQRFCFSIPDAYSDAAAAPLLCAGLIGYRSLVMCGGIHMSDVPRFPYRLLWGERVVRSVANLTRRDGEEFLRLAPQVPVNTQVQTFTLHAANEALTALRNGRLRGAAVLLP